MNYRKLYSDLQQVHEALNVKGPTGPQPNVPLASFYLGAIMAKAQMRAAEQEEALTVSEKPGYPAGLPAA